MSGKTVFLFLCVMLLIPGEAYCQKAPADGVQTEYYESGKIRGESQYKDGELHGVTKLYYENGFLQEEAHYYKGQRHGITRKYYTNGLLSERTFYRYGKIHGVPFIFKYGDIDPSRHGSGQGQENNQEENYNVILKVVPEAQASSDRATLKRIENILNDRINFASIPNCTLKVEENQIQVRMKSLLTWEDITIFLTTPGVLLFKSVEEDPETIQANKTKLAENYEWLPDDSEQLLVKKEAWLTLSAVESAEIAINSQDQSFVLLKLPREKARILAQVTQDLVGHKTALVLDQTLLSVWDIKAPVVNGQVRIENESFSEDMKRCLFGIIKNPPLPVPLEIMPEEM